MPNFDFRLLNKLVLSGLLICFWIAAARYLVDGLSALSLPFSTSRPEAFVLDGAMRVRAGEPLYVPIFQAPTTLHVYNPFAYTVAAWAAWPFGTGPEALLRSGRVISLIASLGLSLLLGLWAYRAYRSIAAVVFVAAAPFFFHEIVLTQFFLLRPESPATLFSAAAVLSLAMRDRTTHSIVLSAALCLLSFLFKQSFIAAPLALTVYFGLQRRWRDLAVFVAVFGTGISLFLALMWLQTGLGYFDNAVTAMSTNNLYLIDAIKTYSAYFFGTSYGLLLALPAVLLFTILTAKRDVLMVYWVVAIVWSVFASGKLGSSANYYAEVRCRNPAVNDARVVLADQ